MKKYKKRYYVLASRLFEGHSLYSSQIRVFGYTGKPEDYQLGRNERNQRHLSPFVFVEASDLVYFYERYSYPSIFGASDLMLVEIELPDSVKANRLCLPPSKNREIACYTSDTIIVKSVRNFLEDENAMREFVDHIDTDKKHDSLLRLFNSVYFNGSLAVINQILERGNFYVCDTRFNPAASIEYKHPEVFSMLLEKSNEEYDKQKELFFPEDTTVSGVDSDLSQSEQDTMYPIICLDTGINRMDILRTLGSIQRTLRSYQHRQEDEIHFVLGEIQPGRGARGTYLEYLDVINTIGNALHDVTDKRTGLVIQETDTLFQTDTVDEEREER